VSGFEFEIKKAAETNLEDFIAEAQKITELVGDPIVYGLDRFKFEFKVDATSEIGDLCRKAVKIATIIGDPVDFLFDEIEINAYPLDDPEELEADWRKRNGMRGSG
jgi:hypothetical protein